MHKCATLPFALRVGSLLSLVAAGWSIYKIEATPDGGGLPYFLFWTPLFLGITVVLIVTSFLVRKDSKGSNTRSERGPSTNTASSTSSRLNAWVNSLLVIGVLALMGEAIAILFEGKQLQALELSVLSAAVVGFCLWKGRLSSEVKQALNLLTIGFLILLGLSWWWILDFILAIFDR